MTLEDVPVRFVFSWRDRWFTVAISRHQDNVVYAMDPRLCIPLVKEQLLDDFRLCLMSALR